MAYFSLLITNWQNYCNLIEHIFWKNHFKKINNIFWEPIAPKIALDGKITEHKIFSSQTIVNARKWWQPISLIMLEDSDNEYNGNDN